MKKNILTLLVLLLMSFSIIVGCSDQDLKQKENDKKTELTISAAASLTNALNELKTSFEKENSNLTLTFNFGSSGKLAQQIQQGAPVDVFLSADQKWMDTLQNEKLITLDTRIDFTGNKIVLIAHKDKDFSLASFKDLEAKDFNDIAIGSPESVPAGNYTKETLKSIGKWDELKSKFVLAKDVRQVLTYVESGNTDIGFVYSSDALISDQVKVVAEADSAWHSPIIYPAAVTSDSKYQNEAALFIKFLQTEQAQKILNKYGFTK